MNGKGLLAGALAFSLAVSVSCGLADCNVREYGANGEGVTLDTAVSSVAADRLPAISEKPTSCVARASTGPCEDLTEHYIRNKKTCRE